MITLKRTLLFLLIVGAVSAAAYLASGWVAEALERVFELTRTVSIEALG